ncbi:ribosome assembly RNA-binding protein YhbY [Paucibacter aquatile]|uniref:Ribosome assembly RNA-binding protein YhbY n=1 Tax=Kinneretia aquatilis TaxID=2070761 RepID=A0A2N8KSD5_9BURK|nr:YhbY family RNA-binding protein [Paucibacter aquatile]PND36353.1 ribosome assembly RNA-binding protein YhbY [Paucibacter aquatile]
MPAIQLTPAQRKEKRSEAHHLDPMVMIGADGLTPAVVKATDAALNAHGLIKVRIFSDDRANREGIFASLCGELNAAPIQHIGKLLIIWRPIPPKEDEANTRADSKLGPRVVKIVKFSKSGNHRPQTKKLRVLGNERVAQGGEIKRAKRRLTSIKKSSQDQ